MCKLWLVHNEEIYGYTTFYDCLWFLNSAKHWYWGMPYGWTAFIRPPAYPLFIAMVHEFGIPLRIAIELLQIGAYCVLIAALRSAAVPRWLCLSIFIALVLHPASFQLNNLVEADTLYAALLTYAVGVLILTLHTRRIAPAIFSGIALGTLWNTREESLLVAVFFVSYVLVAFLYEKTEAVSSRDAGKILLKPALSIFLAGAVLILAVYSANYFVFHEFAKSQSSSPSFNAAYRALLRIKPTRPQRFVGVTRDAREAAFQVSPTFAQLRPYFEGDLGRDWEMETLSAHGVPHEIGNAWFMWALRDIVSHAGFYNDPEATRRFYRQVAAEIDLACHQGRLPTRWVFFDFLDPEFLRYLRFVPQSLGRISSLFVWRHKMSRDREDAILRTPERLLYDEMAGRRAALTRIGTLRLVGWAFDFDDPVQLVAYDSGGGEIVSATTHFSPSPNIAESFKERGRVPENIEFGLSMEVRRGKIPAGELLFVTQSGRKFSRWVSAIVFGEAPRENGAPTGAPLMCQIFAREFTPSIINHSIRHENNIATCYRYFVFACSLLATVAVLALIIFFRRLRIHDSLNAVIILLVIAVASRFGLFVLLDATCFNGQDVRYLFPVMPLYSALLILLIYRAARLALSSRATSVARIDD